MSGLPAGGLIEQIAEIEAAQYRRHGAIWWLVGAVSGALLSWWIFA